jgi:hypothetical protein
VEISTAEKWTVPAEDGYAVHLFRDYNVQKAESNHGFYGDQDAELRFKSGTRTTPWLMVWRPLKYFLYQYLRCGSIRYGSAGFIYAALFAQLEMNIQFKIWEHQNKFELSKLIEKNLSLREEMKRKDG